MLVQDFRSTPKAAMQPHWLYWYTGRVGQSLYRTWWELQEWCYGLDRIFYLHYHHMICNLGLQGCLMYRFQTNYLIISTAMKLHAIYLRLSSGTVDISSLLCMCCSSITLKVHTFVTFLRTSFWPTTFCTITMISHKQFSYISYMPGILFMSIFLSSWYILLPYGSLVPVFGRLNQ